MDMKNKTKVQISLMEKIAEIITNNINSYLHKEGLELQKMKLGLEILLINISKFIVIFTVAAGFNLLKESIFMSLIFASIRRNAFGLHAKNSLICTLVSLSIFVLGSYLSYYLKFNNFTVFIIFTIVNILLYKYAPADTENHPLIGANLRKKRKKEAITIGIVLMIIALLIPSNVIKTLMSLSAISAVIVILPITYSLMKRGYRNYEKYEREFI
ncbi:accessory gene regulator protein B [Clostridium saccharobutylicum]|nr:accessory gene regulator protein B [Clostridium saccharobutylicum]AQS02559.1 accessory protein regulator protein B [Clostridium saccharobutylicum]AQS12164.1 accessory gene regulator protein B [Clostridium saccharobutylicum]AQS16542.1 accessory gene regulator protein B [Clostridium saccharobutylicum]OOM18165.1 accessory protein regulator protein B [Clostridium saccharobutylicum]